MFIGHWAPAMVAATRKDAPSLPTLFLAGQFVDWAFFGLVIVGVEKMRIEPGITKMNALDLYHMPYTHSLLGTCLFAALFAAIVYAVTRKKAAASIAGAVVISHWFLDWLVHRPDLTLLGAPPKLGLGLWNHPALEMPLELGLTFGALAMYAAWKKSDPKRLLVFAALLLAIQLFDWFSPPPPSDGITMLSFMAFLGYGVVTLAAWWVDRSSDRKPRWSK